MSDILTFHMLVGPCGAGKSTYSAKLLKELSHASLVCPDNIREELTGDVADQSKNGFIFNSVVPIRINGAHGQRKHVVYDATCYNRKNRKSIIEHAREQGYQIVAHIFRTPIEVCQARNAARDRKVPASVIERQFENWQEPELSEGIDRIVEVPHVD